MSAHLSFEVDVAYEMVYVVVMFCRFLLKLNYLLSCEGVVHLADYI